MNGIEKITARISADAEEEIRAVREGSASRCSELKAEYEKKAQEEYWALVRVGVKEAEQRVQRLSRTAKLEMKKSMLSMKQEMVSKAFELARERIVGLPEPDYVAFLARQASQAAVSGQEEILLNEGDRTRCGQKVVKAANELLGKRGIRPALTLGDSVRPVFGGLILKQGDIEVNCTVDTLLELSRVELAAQVAEVLFPEA
jgi:V/A-type H+-transporting ATPase subunit E